MNCIALGSLRLCTTRHTRLSSNADAVLLWLLLTALHNGDDLLLPNLFISRVLEQLAFNVTTNCPSRTAAALRWSHEALVIAYRVT